MNVEVFYQKRPYSVPPLCFLKWGSSRNRLPRYHHGRPRWLGVERVGALSQQRRRRRRRTRTATTMQRSSLSVALACIALCCCNTRAEYCPSANDLTVAYTVPGAVNQLRDGGWQSKGGPSPSPGCSCPVVICCVISISFDPGLLDPPDSLSLFHRGLPLS